MQVEAVTGYLHPDYAKSLAEFGVPRELPKCKAWILQRPIPGSPYCDGMGCYPLFACHDWSELHSELDNLGKELVTLSLVADPFGEYDLTYLRKCFDIVIPFKEHFVADLQHPMNVVVSSHHRYYALRSLRKVSVERCADPAQFVSEWVDLYTNLIDRHSLTGIKAFSKAAFAKQLSLPGTVIFRALHQGTTVGAVWYVHQGEVGYNHLSAFSPDGYRLRASYALQWCAIEYFIDKLRWLDLGGGAGVKGNGRDGLSVFKRGWTTGTRTAYFCGRIFDEEKYSELVKAKGISVADYFPSYRRGEFE